MDRPLCNLKGTAKQIKWASELREELISDAQKEREGTSRMKNLHLVLDTQCDATWWITNRKALDIAHFGYHSYIGKLTGLPRTIIFPELEPNERR